MDKSQLPEPEEWVADPFYDHLAALRGAKSMDDVPYYYWHQELQVQYPLHPCVTKALSYRPLDFAKLALEWPHVSTTDPTRLAYTRSISDGENSRKLVTSIGKYLARHWPHLPDHVRRDIQALFTPDTMGFVYTLPEIIAGIEFGPRSCMASIAGYISDRFNSVSQAELDLWRQDPTKPEPDWTRHPYSSYHPKFGWHMALRTSPMGSIDGRALCLIHNEAKIFVRTYRRHTTDPAGWSETDFSLQGWLINQGYKHANSWPTGAKLQIVEQSSDEIWAPYIDGNRRRIVPIDAGVYKLDDDGYYCCECTNGVVSRDDPDDDDEDDDNYTDCDSCGGRYHRDGLTSVGRHGDGGQICSGCLEDNYFEVRGDSNSHSNGYRYYYLDADNSSSVERQNYFVDTDYLPPGVICLEEGGYAEVDDCVEIDGDYYLNDDQRIVHYVSPCSTSGDTYGLKSCSFRDHANGDWWACKADYEASLPEETELPPPVAWTPYTPSLTALESTV